VRHGNTELKGNGGPARGVSMVGKDFRQTRGVSVFAGKPASLTRGTDAAPPAVVVFVGGRPTAPRGAAVSISPVETFIEGARSFARSEC